MVILQPFVTEEKIPSLAYQVISEEDTKSYMEIDLDSIQKKLCGFLNLTKHQTDIKEGILLDYYTAAIWWAREQGFSDKQLSGFFTVTHTLIENIRDKHLSLLDNIKELKMMMMGIGSKQPVKVSGGLEFFDIKQATTIIDYFFSSLFQHYQLYNFMFSHTPSEEIIGYDLDIEVLKAAELPFPPPLDEGMPVDIYKTYMTPADKKAVTPETAPEDQQKPDAEADEENAKNILAELTPEDVKEIVNSVAKEMLGDFHDHIASKLREKENQLINKINKIHKIAQTKSQ